MGGGGTAGGGDIMGGSAGGSGAAGAAGFTFCLSLLLRLILSLLGLLLRPFQSFYWREDEKFFPLVL